MPSKNLTDLITDQEMAFARLVLGGTMNDRDAAEAAGLNPDTAACTKSNPRVREYMLEHRATVEQQLVALEVEEQRQRYLLRQDIRGYLLEFVKMSPALTRGSITGQVKAVSLLMAMEGLLPDRRAGSALPQRPEKDSTPPPVTAQIYQAEWLREQQEKAIDPEPSPEHAQHEEEPALAESEPAPAPMTPATTLDPLAPERTSWVPDALSPADAPDTRAPLWLQMQMNRWRR